MAISCWKTTENESQALKWNHISLKSVYILASNENSASFNQAENDHDHLLWYVANTVANHNHCDQSMYIEEQTQREKWKKNMSVKRIETVKKANYSHLGRFAIWKEKKKKNTYTQWLFVYGRILNV